ncbi:MAG: hypothetical protein U0518_00370 [Candidatus Gracilibacteria bacterium]
MGGGGPEQYTPSVKEEKVNPKPTVESTTVAQDALDAAKTDTQKDLTKLQQEISKVKVEKNGVRKFTEALTYNQNYKKQVEQILGTPLGESRESTAIIADIETLQSNLNVTPDGALGPKTFKALKGEWDKSKEQNPKLTYKEFINNLINRKIDVPTTPTNPVLLNDKPTITGSVITEAVTETDPTKDLKLDKDSNKVIFGNNSFDFELQGDWKTLGIDRDAYKIIDNKSSYDLNIRGKEDNVRIDKLGLKEAIKDEKQTIEGTTIPKKGGLGEPVTIMINKTEGKKELAKKENKATDTAPINPIATNDSSPNNINITLGNITLDKQNTIQPGIDTRSSLEQNLSNIPLHQDFQVDTNISPALQAQIAIQPVQDVLQDTAT